MQARRDYFVAGLLTFHNRLTYNNPTPHPRPAPQEPTMTATTSHTRTVSLVLDFEVSRLGTTWTVFDARTAKDLATGTGAGKTDCVVCAMAEIADRSPARVYALKHEGSWVVRLHSMWAPLPLTPAATRADVFAYLTDVVAKGRQVEVVDLPKLTAAI